MALMTLGEFIRETIVVLKESYGLEEFRATSLAQNHAALLVEHYNTRVASKGVSLSNTEGEPNYAAWRIMFAEVRDQ